MSGVFPIAILALVWPTNGGLIIDLLHVSDENVPTSLSPQSSCSGLDEGDVVMVPLDGGKGDRLVESLPPLLAAAIAVVQ